MQNPGSLYNVKTERSGASRYAGIAFVGAVHLVIIYALVTGLAKRIVANVTPDLIVQAVAPQTPTQPLPQPPVTLTKPEPSDTVPQPLFDISTPAAKAAPQAVSTQPAQTSTQPAQPVNTDAVAVEGTHSTPPYPPIARRLGQSGTVTLQLSIAPDGSVQSATVVTSSGVPVLDQAAIDWVTAHWRYKPALQNGAATASTTQARVRFDLASAN